MPPPPSSVHLLFSLYFSYRSHNIVTILFPLLGTQTFYLTHRRFLFKNMHNLPCFFTGHPVGSTGKAREKQRNKRASERGGEQAALLRSPGPQAASEQLGAPGSKRLAARCECTVKCGVCGTSLPVYHRNKLMR